MPTPTVGPTLAATAVPLDPPGAPVLFFYAFDGHLYRTDEAGSFKEQLTISPEKPSDGADVDTGLTLFRPPQVSPDGLWLLLNDGRGGWTLLDLSASQEAARGQGQAILSLTWAANSQQFAYLGLHNQLCIFNLPDRVETCPFQNVNRLQEASWSPNGEHIAVAALDPVADGGDCCTGQVWLFNLQDGQAEVAVTYVTGFETVANELLAWLPDGSGLVIKKMADGGAVLFSPADGSIIPFNEPVLDVSPDGRYLLHPSGAVSAADGSVVFTLPDTECTGYLGLEWTWSSNGDRLAYMPSCQAANESQRFLYTFDLLTGDLLWQEELAPQLSVAGWSPDGQYLLLLNRTSGWPQDTSIWRLPAGGDGSLETVIEQGLLLDVIPQWDNSPPD